MKSSKIVVVGSANTDMIIQLERIPRPGETILGGEFSMAAGGKGANQAVAAARAGGAVDFIACVGEDMFGQQAVAGFEKDGINMAHIIRHPTSPSGVALIFVDQKGENSIAVASGANGQLLPEHINGAAEAIASAGILVMQLEIPMVTVHKAAALAADNNVKVILNPAPAQMLSDELLANISILTPNETEAELLTGIAVNNESDAAAAAKVLLGKGVEFVIITLGEKGAFVATSDSCEIISGFTVETVDSTAAGDTFNGALAVALGENKSLKAAVRFANAAAALSVTKLGAQPSAPRREEIDGLFGQEV